MGMTQPLPNIEPTDLSRPYWDALAQGDLLFQHCLSCGANQLPPRHDCTTCLSPDLEWRKASGRAKLVTWVEYHRAYDPAFKDQVPYNVAIVALDEGPRLVTNVVTDATGALRLDQPLTFRRAERFGQAITSFVPA